MKCPKCGSTYVMVELTLWAHVINLSDGNFYASTDDNIINIKTLHDLQRASCDKCDHTGTIGTFNI